MPLSLPIKWLKEWSPKMLEFPQEYPSGKKNLKPLEEPKEELVFWLETCNLSVALRGEIRKHKATSFLAAYIYFSIVVYLNHIVTWNIPLHCVYVTVTGLIKKLTGLHLGRIRLGMRTRLGECWDEGVTGVWEDAMRCRVSRMGSTQMR